MLCRPRELVCLGHHTSPSPLPLSPAAGERGRGEGASGRILSLDEIVARMLAEARKGRIVVRLKGGDPSVFGRGADETSALRDSGIPFEIVPGITAALAAAAYCEIPITHHQQASAVALIAGQERHAKAAPCLDYASLATFPGTLIFYMGVTTAAQWSGALIEHGKPPETPVAIIRRCTWVEQQEIRCTLGTVAETVRAHRLRPPALFIVGKVVDYAPRLSWFAAQQRKLVADEAVPGPNAGDPPEYSIRPTA